MKAVKALKSSGKIVKTPTMSDGDRKNGGEKKSRIFLKTKRNLGNRTDELARFQRYER
jgi:hypothetical protein